MSGNYYALARRKRSFHLLKLDMWLVYFTKICFSEMIDDLGRKKEKKKRRLSISKKRLVHGDDDLLVDNSSLAFKREIPCSGYLQNSQPTILYLSKRL